MGKRRFRRKPAGQKLPCLIFTLEQLVVLRSALAPFEEMIRAQKKPLPNSDFALETVKQVQAKIQQLITLRAWCEPVAFDSNEIIILQASVWIFALSLEAGERSPEKERLKEQCRLLDSLLASPQRRMQQIPGMRD